MSDDSLRGLEGILEAAARRVSGGKLHPLELLQRLQTAAEASVRDGNVGNDYRITLSAADHNRYAPVLERLASHAVQRLGSLEQRNGWRRIGEFKVRFESSTEVAEGAAVVTSRFIEPRGGDVAHRPGVTRAINRHRRVVLRLDDGAFVQLTHTPFTIGRGPGNDLVLPVLSVSRNHAEIVESEGGFVMLDLGSRNGLVVNGVRVMEQPLDEGVNVILGDAGIRLERI